MSVRGGERTKWMAHVAAEFHWAFVAEREMSATFEGMGRMVFMEAAVQNFSGALEWSARASILSVQLQIPHSMEGFSSRLLSTRLDIVTLTTGRSVLRLHNNTAGITHHSQPLAMRLLVQRDLGSPTVWHLQMAAPFINYHYRTCPTWQP